MGLPTALDNARSRLEGFRAKVQTNVQTKFPKLGGMMGQGILAQGGGGENILDRVRTRVQTRTAGVRGGGGGGPLGMGLLPQGFRFGLFSQAAFRQFDGGDIPTDPTTRGTSAGEFRKFK